MVTALLDAGMSPEGDGGWTCVDTLRDLGLLPPVYSPLRSPLEVAISEGCDDIANRLLDAGAKALRPRPLDDVDSHFPALCLINKSSVPLVQRLIQAVQDADGDIFAAISNPRGSNFGTEDGMTPLHAAAHG